MSTRAAVLDACALVPASLRDTLLWSAYLGAYRPNWGREIPQEVERTLARVRNDQDARRAVASMDRTFPGASVPVPPRLIDSMTNHPEDRHVLAVAVAAGARVIVTSNPRHFPKRSLAPFGVEVQTPDRFLTRLFGDEPAILVEAIRQQSAATRRPHLSVDRILDNLTKVRRARFSTLVRQHIAETAAEDLSP